MSIDPRVSNTWGMARIATFAVAALLAALLVEGIYGATGKPVLISAGSRSGHVVVTFSLRGAVAGSFVAATSPRTDISGALTSGVKLREALRVGAAAGVARFRSRGVLRRGRYFVQVSGVDPDGVTDCIRLRRACGVAWSNVRSVVVPSR